MICMLRSIETTRFFYDGLLFALFGPAGAKSSFYPRVTIYSEVLKDFKSTSYLALCLGKSVKALQ